MRADNIGRLDFRKGTAYNGNVHCRKGSSMPQIVILSFLAGVLAANGTPHFVKGITKEPFPSLLGPTPVVNLVAGWALYAAAAVVLELAHPGAHPAWATAAAGVGVLAMGVFHATIGAFGVSPRRR
jgi:hypothetical protein